MSGVSCVNERGYLLNREWGTGNLLKRESVNGESLNAVIFLRLGRTLRSVTVISYSKH